MQLQNGFVNHFVVVIFEYYIFCSSRTRGSIRDYKVSEYEASRVAAVSGSARERLIARIHPGMRRRDRYRIQVSLRYELL